MTFELLSCIWLTIMVWFLLLRIEKLEQWRRDVESTGLPPPSERNSK